MRFGNRARSIHEGDPHPLALTWKGTRKTDADDMSVGRAKPGESATTSRLPMESYASVEDRSTRVSRKQHSRGGARIAKNPGICARDHAGMRLNKDGISG